MSELKARHIIDVYNSYYYAENPFGERSQVYLKSEADKVIAYLKNEIEEQKRLCDMALASVPNVLKVMKIIQHHKYKRCLAMAMWCWAIKELNRYGDQDYMDFAEKWRKRWLKLAEKFKEAK